VGDVLRIASPRAVFNMPSEVVQRLPRACAYGRVSPISNDSVLWVEFPLPADALDFDSVGVRTASAGWSVHEPFFHLLEAGGKRVIDTLGVSFCNMRPRLMRVPEIHNVARALVITRIQRAVVHFLYRPGGRAFLRSSHDWREQLVAGERQ
jgi:hypothetical protein